MDKCDTLSWASWAAKRHRPCLVTGKGLMREKVQKRK